MSRHLTPNKHHPSRSGASLDTVQRNDTPATAAGTGPMLAAPCTHRAAKPIALAPSPPRVNLWSPRTNVCPTTEPQRIFLINLRLPQPTGRYNTTARLETPCACQPRALAPRPRWQRSSFRKDLHAAQPLNRGPEDGTSAPRPPQHRRSLFLKTRRPVHPPAHTGRKASESLTLIQRIATRPMSH